MFDPTVITRNIDLFRFGLEITLYYTLLTTALGLAIGLLVALAQLAPARALVLSARLFVEFFRSVPLLVWLLWTFYALPVYLDIPISKEAAGILALSLYAAAYYAEIIRAGIQSLEGGQRDAARALGMSATQGLRRIILPQALRRMVPPLAGQTTITMKNTTLLSVLTIPDLLYQAGYIASFTYRPMEVYTMVGVIFMLILVPSNYIVRRLELRAQ